LTVARSGLNLERHDLTVDVMKKKIKRKEGIRMRGNTKHLVFSVCVAFVLCAFASVASARTIYVPDDYAKIQWAVDNASDGDTIIVRDGNYYENVVVSKKLTIKSENGSDNCIIDGGGSGTVITLNANGITIEGFTVRNSGSYWPDVGIKVVSNANNITYNCITNNWAGIYLNSSCNNNIYNNNASNNSCGIGLSSSSSNTIANNIVSNNDCGIRLSLSSNNIIANNTALNNDYGIRLSLSSNNIIASNTALNNDYGILFESSSNNTITNNTVSSNNYYGIHLVSPWIIIIGAGRLTSSSNNIIVNNTVSNNYGGICLLGSSNNTIANNIVSNNDYGIHLLDSGNNTIANNTVSSNNDYGILLACSSINIIYLNNFINNTDQVYSYDSTNIWNSTEKITYTYNGKQYTNYLGNYWSDYKGGDADSDGVGDTPYSIDGDADNYPLMQPWERYFPTAPTPIPVQTFDTGRPDNPYPSISGKFVGTIKTDKKIIAKKLYTYACEGTGGHTEYALICNSSWCAEAKWEGYRGDWMNISFNRTVVLMPYETYNITIVTGSYPQIHHTHSLKTENGFINCTEFTDANGNKYENWIPAIKLWS